MFKSQAKPITSLITKLSFYKNSMSNGLFGLASVSAGYYAAKHDDDSQSKTIKPRTSIAAIVSSDEFAQYKDYLGRHAFHPLVKLDEVESIIKQIKQGNLKLTNEQKQKYDVTLSTSRTYDAFSSEAKMYWGNKYGDLKDLRYTETGAKNTFKTILEPNPDKSYYYAPDHSIFVVHNNDYDEWQIKVRDFYSIQNFARDPIIAVEVDSNDAHCALHLLKIVNHINNSDQKLILLLINKSDKPNGELYLNLESMLAGTEEGRKLYEMLHYKNRDTITLRQDNAFFIDIVLNNSKAEHKDIESINTQPKM